MAKYTLRVHAVQRMFERGISVEDVKHVVENGEVIHEYADDTPYPSRLILGWKELRPLHVVVADHPTEDEKIIITAYEPDPQIWESDFRHKRKGASS